ncbi:hypothetical protein [Nakamurella sp. PAMC28650]|uniref:hypothetical protein n=1 Tax=Nakamurella sp. PAMC28650 TaxID=2762325 RepID=UPI00164DB8CB|nr:hypothetical protein [Nakamurella sp. PAMC28650]QNK82027.1 hypothetical protein H7F38_04380 [Nakamurella sp. PAMC28650]
MSVRLRVSALTASTVAVALFLTGCAGPNLPSVFNAPPTSAGSQAVLPGGSGSGNGGSGSIGAGAFSSDCLGVASAYASIALALIPSLTGGAGVGTYDATQVTKAIAGLGGSVPAPLKGDFQTLSDAAKSASGKSLTDAGQVLGSPAVTAASDDISKWMTTNCGG